VKRVNPKSLTIPALIAMGAEYNEHGQSWWTETKPYHKVYGRIRDGIRYDTPYSDGVHITASSDAPTAAANSDGDDTGTSN
jgi:hypothetical protein